MKIGLQGGQKQKHSANSSDSGELEGPLGLGVEGFRGLGVWGLELRGLGFRVEGFPV